MCFRQKYQESLKITEYPIHQLIRLGRLEVHIAISNPNIDVNILAQGYTLFSHMVICPSNLVYG